MNFWSSFTLQFQIIGGRGLNKRGRPTDDLNINKRGGPNKRGVWKMFSVKSGKLLLHWIRLERQIKVILQSHCQGMTKYIYLKPPWSTFSFIIFWDFSMFYQIFLSSQVKRWAIIAYKHCIYELPHELLNDLRFKILGN